MDDRDVEDLLRAYRPAGPRPEVRERILATARPTGRTWPWAAAAAALIIVTLWSSAGSARVYRELALAPQSPATLDDPGLQHALAEIYGDRSARLLLTEMTADADEDEDATPPIAPELTPQ